MPDREVGSVDQGGNSQVVALIGLGNMGTPMARRLLASGHQVVGFDLSDDALARFVESGGTPAQSAPAAAADADVVILMLPSSKVVEAVVEDGLAAALKPRAVLVDMSSSEPLRTRVLAEKLRTERAIDLVDAPVSGGVNGAIAGKLVIMVGGSRAAVSRVESVLTAMGTPTHVGEVGSGHALKALNNLLSATHLMVTSEAMLAGRRFGLDPAVMLSVINGSSGRSGSTENKWPNFILPETFDSGFALGLMLKDMRIATDLADKLGTPSDLGRESVQFWAKAAEELPAGADHTEIARWLETQRSDRNV
ncbi:NAD(P)-dependent oxidoreductase [Rhodococcus sp. IEGM 1370]|uniref:NAD(P)-dependent oxidoreductase n=1 Tax=Rhodococcus sp. IEGM 1370 TaxID=3082222 RepID=UPI002955A5E9|nr:NAD(P)-dependent oxidoreductase [Rhodococcus sp. IEGM 1370]MDV8079750.1 NAD(P)-dependent oxidoreductase [Rhodococcus sp. IEGM 1370]